MKILIVDDGVGAFPTLNKLCRCLPADYTVLVLGNLFPIGALSPKQCYDAARNVLKSADNFDAVVFSSVALSAVTVKTLATQSSVPLFGCDIPLLHAGTYTASQVLAVGDGLVVQQAKRYPNAIPLTLPNFPFLAESGADEREIVAYVAENAEKYSGSFDCIALGNSSMNLYKNCFSRVFPNVRIFDGLDGVARKMRKIFKKSKDAESTVHVFDENWQDLSKKYNFFIEEFL